MRALPAADILPLRLRVTLVIPPLPFRLAQRFRAPARMFAKPCGSQNASRLGNGPTHPVSRSQGAHPRAKYLPSHNRGSKSAWALTNGHLDDPSDPVLFLEADARVPHYQKA
jgi:hypothetical protein